MHDSGALARFMQRASLFVLLLLLPFSKAAVEITFVLLLVGWIWEHAPVWWRNSLWRKPSSRGLAVALLGYLGVCAASILTSSFPLLSLRGFVGKTLEYVLLFVIAADVVREPVAASRYALVMSVSAAVVCVDAIAQECLGKDPVLGHLLSKYFRMTGPYESPGDLATYLMVMMPMVFYQLVRVRGVWRWRAGALLAALAGCLVRTEARGAWLGLFVGVTALIALDRGRRKALLLGTVAAILGSGLILAHNGVRSMGTRVVDPGFQDRLFMWQTAGKMIHDRPIAGQGLNTFMANYLQYWVGGERLPRYAHNCFLQAAAETGIPGLITFVWVLGMMGWCWVGALRMWDETPLSARLFVLGASAGLFSFIVQSAFDTNFYSLRQAALFWTLAGVVTGVVLKAEPSPAGVSMSDQPHVGRLTLQDTAAPRL